MRHCLVTGAAGFIGRQLCRQLQTQGIHVKAFLRIPAEPGPWQDSAAGDIAEPIASNVMADMDTVFHLAGKAHALSETRQDEKEYFDINTEGTRQLLEAAQQASVRRFVFFSSVKAMHEGGSDCLNETFSCHPETPYGKSKLAAERLVLAGNYVPEPVVLRLPMVYGPAMKGNLPRMIEAVRKGRFPPIPEFGNKRSMVHVEDVIQAALLAATQPEAIGQTYIVTHPQPCSTRELYEWICEAVNRPVPGWRIPEIALRGLAKMGDAIGRWRGRRFIFDSDALAKLAGSAWYSSQKMENELGFQAQHPLRESLADIIKLSNKSGP